MFEKWCSVSTIFRLFLAKECWLRTFRLNVLCSNNLTVSNTHNIWTKEILSFLQNLHFTWPELNTLFNIVTLRVAIFVLIVVSFIYCKTRRIAMVMSVMQFFSGVKSQTPQPFIYRRPTQEPQNDFSTKVQQFIS